MHARPPRLTRRVFLRAGGGLVASVTLAACTQAPPATQPPAPTAAAAPTTAPASSKPAAAPPPKSQLVVAQTADLVTLDPPMYRARQTQNIHQMLYDTLVHRTDDLQLQGRLAESWEIVDNTTYRFKIRANARFHDGTPVTAGDVKFSYDRTLDPALKAPRAGLLDMVAATDAPDDSTVIVHTKQPDPLTLVYLNYHAITPAALVKAQGAGFFDKPVGAGPFAFQEWRKGERLVLTANVNYWDGPPLVQTLIFRPIADPSTTMSELESGGIDIAAEVPPDSFSEVKSNPNLQALTAPSTTVHYVGLNTRLKPMDSVQVRQALNYAIDKDTLIKTIMVGLAKPISGPLFPESRGYDPSVGYTFDLDKARALLKQGGADNGFSVTMDTTASMKQIAEALAGQLKPLGVNVSVNVMDLGVLTTKINNGDCEMYLNNWGDSAADGGVTFYRHFSSSQRETFKDTWYSRPDLDKQIDAARFTFDLDQRRQMLMGAYKTIVDDAPWIFLWQPTMLSAARTNVKGFMPRADAYLFLNKVSVG